MADRDYDRDRGFGDRDRVSDYNRDRDFDRNWTGRPRDVHDREPVARGADEVRSRFRDDDARRRRDMDEQRERDRYRSPRDWARNERAWSGSPERGWGGEYHERGHGASREWGGEREPRNEPGWSVRDRYLQSGGMIPRGGDFGTRDYSNRDYGNVEYANRDYGRRDFGSRDYGSGSRYEEPSNWTLSGYGAAGSTSGGYAREDWGPRTGHPGHEGRFAGRGPRNYQRSDERVREDVNERLTNDPRIDATDVEVEVSGGEVTLRGQVDDRRTRRLAEECIEDVPGVRDVKNELRAGRHARDEGTTEREHRKK